MEELVKKFGADPNFASEKFSPIKFAMVGKHLMTVKQLIDLGAVYEEEKEDSVIMSSSYLLKKQNGELIKEGSSIEYEDIRKFLEASTKKKSNE